MRKEPIVAVATIERETGLPVTMTSRRLLAVALFVLGAGAAAVALLGPLVFEVVRHHASESAVNQIAGGDIAGLFLAAPISVAAGFLVLRGHVAGPVLALAPAVYGLYTYTQLTLGGDFVRYEGNSERFFLLYAGLFVVSGFVAIRAWTAIDPNRLPPMSPRLGKGLAYLLFGVAVFLVVGLHLPTLIDAWRDNPTSTAYLDDPGVFWIVKLMDFAIVAPVLVVIAIGILRGARWAGEIVYGAVGWFALLGTSVAGMAIVMQATDDPSATIANTIAFGAFAVAGLAVAVLAVRPLFVEPLRDAGADGSTPPVEEPRAEETLVPVAAGNG
jgi:hypothetical protein